MTGVGPVERARVLGRACASIGVAMSMSMAAAGAVAVSAPPSASGPAPGEPATSPVAAVRGPARAGGLQPCRLPGLATEARCGRLERPLDPARPQGPSLGVAFAVLPAVARVPRADPVVFLAGGPGQGALDLAGPVQGLLGRLNNRRDLILVDLRGTGRSAPLACGFDGPDAARRPLAESLDPARREAAVADCRRALAATPLGDLRFYGTSRAVEDLLAVLDVLGHRQVNLVGASYGTRVALEFARQAPERLRRSVLDGVAPPDMRLLRSGVADQQAALDRLLDACEQDAACAGTHPALRTRLQALLAAAPRRVEVRHPVTGDPETLTLDRRTLLAWLRAPLYLPALSAGLPAAVAAAAEGRLEPLVGLAASVDAAGGGRFATGLHLSVVCSEDGPEAGVAPEAAAEPFDSPYRALCRDWPRFEPPAGFRTVPPARSPVWLLSGGADPVTPPHHGTRAAAALGALAVHTVVPAAGHGLLGLACVRDGLARFLDEPEGERALAEARSAGERCASRLPRPGFRAAPWSAAAAEGTPGSPPSAPPPAPGAPR